MQWERLVNNLTAPRTVFSNLKSSRYVGLPLSTNVEKWCLGSIQGIGQCIQRSPGGSLEQVALCLKNSGH